jgi:hypothetical protein
VYAVGHALVGASGRRLAAVRAYGAGALLSHWTAADQWGLRRSASAKIDVLTSARSRTGRPGIRLHRTRSLHPDDIAELDRIPITSVSRTIVDMAAAGTAHDVERAVHEAEVQRLLDVRAVEAALERTPNAKHTADVRAAIATPSPGPTRRDLEDGFLALCRRHGIPDPILNAGVPTRIGVLEVDALWPAEQLVVELDGAATHHTRKAFERDRRRDAALIVARHTVMRLTWDRITTDEDAVVADLAATRSHLQSRP